MKLYKVKKIEKFLLWLPRILAILYILFLALFALDVFEGGYGFIGTIIALFMHLIPNFGLILILIIAWKKQVIGGILYLLLGFIFTFFFKTYQEITTLILVSGPLFLIGTLFIFGHSRK